MNLNSNKGAGPDGIPNIFLTIETRDTLPSPKELKVKILEYNESTREESGNDLVAMAFCPKKGHVQSGGKREFRCYKCGGKGHKANACPSKKVNKSPSKPNDLANNVDAAFTVSHTVMNSDCVYKAATKAANKPRVLDSGCTSHLCGTFTKLIEKMVLPQLTSSFKNIISTKQHGFVGGRSTTTSLYTY
ncbi:Protein of unknown function, partial [Cotesia congregata]